MNCFFFYGYGDHRDLPVLTHPFPTRRSSDLSPPCPLAWKAAGRSAPHSSFAGLTGESRRLRGHLTWKSPPPRRLQHLVEEEDVGEQGAQVRSEEHTSELQSLMRISYAVFCLKKKNQNIITHSSRLEVY